LFSFAAAGTYLTGNHRDLTWSVSLKWNITTVICPERILARVSELAAARSDTADASPTIRWRQLALEDTEVSFGVLDFSTRLLGGTRCYKFLQISYHGGV
jgi:hypothetical protein